MANRGAGGVRGPKSALTDFLAEHNISATGIQTSMRARRDEAQRLQDEDAANAAPNETEEQAAEAKAEEDEMEIEAAEARQTRKRKRKEQQAIEKIKKSKKLAKEKARQNGDASDDEVLRDAYNKAKPLPGQMEHCEECNVRFTVTAYTRQGPEGGLLCAKCGKKYEAADKKKKATQKKQAASKGNRSLAQSKILDGDSPFGTRSLREICVERIKNSIEDIEDFGDIPTALYDPLSMILSKWRVLNSRTLDLLLNADQKRVALYDAAALRTDDFVRIFQICPRLEVADLRKCGQLKDNVIDFIMERNIPLREVRFDACNLVTDTKWQEFFTKMGPHLESLQLSWLDVALSNESLRFLTDDCPNLKRIKLKLCWLLDETALELLGQIKQLEHLSLEFIHKTGPGKLADLIKQVGNNLRSLSLHNFEDADDRLIESIATCKRLRKLVVTKNSCITDEAFAELFRRWDNPPLEKVVFTKCRDLSSNPRLPTTESFGNPAIGFSSAGFTALMKHSGQRLKKLELVSCRTISHEALFSIFNGVTIYPELTDIDLSFVQKVDDVIVAGIFKSCPKLSRFTAFGCFDILNIRIPRGVSVVGVPSWKDGLIQEGTENVDHE